MSSLYELVGKCLELQKKLEVLNFDEETIADSLEGDSTELTAKIEAMVLLSAILKPLEMQSRQKKRALQNAVKHTKSASLISSRGCWKICRLAV